MIFTLGLALTQVLLPLANPAQPGKLAPEPAPNPVTISVDTVAKGADVAYRTVIHNTGSTPVATMITQQLPAGAHDATATDGGGIRGDNIQWIVTIPRGGVVTVGSTATTPMPRPTTFSSVCVVGKDGNALDCASGVVAATVIPRQPLWRHVLPWTAAGLLAMGVLLWGGRWAWRHKPKRKPRPARTPQEERPKRHTATAVSASAVALLATLIGIILMLTPMMKKTLTQMAGSKASGWNGTASPLLPGAAVTDHAVEFTMYQVHCTKDNGCTVVVAARNTSSQPQLFYRSMQRLYTGSDTWVTPDNADDFFQPLAAGARRLVTLHFPLGSKQIPTRLELREGAFARGVYYKLS